MVPLVIKHGGKTYPLVANLAGSGADFKEAVFQVTGVPPDRMKVMVKGGILKDDADLSKLGFKDNQSVTVIGTAGALPKAPSDQAIFLEDMNDAGLAIATGMPPGLVNLGQTCYLNSSLQALRTIPELQVALEGRNIASGSPEGRLASSVKNLYSGMAQTTEPVPPFALLNNLRVLAPQFAEQDSRGNFAQQDADEAWTQIISALRSCLSGGNTEESFIDRYMSLELMTTSHCIDAPNEIPSVHTETLLKLECNISVSTNFLSSGILDSLDQQIEKYSPTLERTAAYQQKARVSRLPRYLAVHMVRFYWRRDIQKKAKIMRKVKFPLQLDVLDLVTDELRLKLQPVNVALKRVIQGRDDRIKQAARSKSGIPNEVSEEQSRQSESAQIDALMESTGLDAEGENRSGLYELCAMVTHKGASADSGHYIGWARKDNSGAQVTGEETWYKFDDDKVSVVQAVLSLDGGGEDSVAYILLYRSAS